MNWRRVVIIAAFYVGLALWHGGWHSTNAVAGLLSRALGIGLMTVFVARALDRGTVA